jgi:hypothetical protein
MGGWEGILMKLAIGIPVAGLAIVSVVAARRSRPALTTEGELVMRFSLPMRLFGVFAGLIVPLAVCALLIVFTPKDWNELYATVGGLLVFLLLGDWLLLETQYVHVSVSDKGIIYHSPWRRECAYAWDDVAEVSTFSYMYPFIFRGRDGRKFAVAMVLTGVSQLAKLIRTHLDPPVYEKAHRGFHWSGIGD